MSHHTRRQFLGFVASLLTLIDAARRFFKSPEAADDQPIWTDKHVREIDGPPVRLYPGINPDDLLRDILERDGLDLCEPIFPGFGDKRLMPTEQDVRTLAARLGVTLKDRTLS
ncbi:MAG: hypothetical protein C0483_18625 [Pirellula sp.]|nr:hypothetical protein [Pirellula sp.]